MNLGVVMVDTVAFPCVNCGETEFTVVFKEDTLHRHVCPRCKAVTYAYITKNLELRVFREKELCPSCKGTGLCPDCRGTGKVNCPDCDGKGYHSDEYYEYVGCARCGGSGSGSRIERIKRGSGKIDCSKCLSTGVCSACRGLRFISSSSSAG